MGAADLQLGKKLAQIFGEHVEGIRSLRRLAAAVAAGVVDEDPEAVLELRDLPVPHPQAAGERMAEGKPRRVLTAVDLVVGLDAVRLRLHVASRMSGMSIS